MKAFLLTISLLLGAIAAGNAVAPVPGSYDHNPAAGKFYDIRGIKIYCEIYGQGPPLLLVHGNGGDIGSFANNIPFLARHFRVIAADSRAQGRSKDYGSRLTFEDMADDSAALLDALHVKAAYVLGWSDGGNVALLLAMRHPDKVIKLAESGANLWAGPDAFSPAAWQEERKEYEAGRDVIRTTDDEKNQWKIFMPDYDQPHIFPRSLQSIRCPCLIMAGDRDMISLQHTVLIYQNIPKAWLWIVPNAGHDTLVNHRDEFNQKVYDFFSTPWPKSS